MYNVTIICTVEKYNNKNKLMNTHRGFITNSQDLVIAMVDTLTTITRENVRSLFPKNVEISQETEISELRGYTTLKFSYNFKNILSFRMFQNENLVAFVCNVST